MYEERGWALPEGGAGHSAKKAKTKATLKRGASEGEGEDGVPEKPSKKPRAPRKKKVESVQAERKDSGAEEDEKMGFVKEEPVEEEI